MIMENPVPCDDEFFVVDRTYFEFQETTLNTLTSPFDSDGEFWCKAVFVHPSMEMLCAIGLARDDPRSPWEEWPVIFTIEDWKNKVWFRTYSGGEEDKPHA